MRRFRNERQILAGMSHPYMAELHDGGTTEEGLPYFVMEYIERRPIDEYCDSHKLSIAERLKLFRKVCAAVHFAHQNLVVHRDLKPANILVTAEGKPKLLDFGIAKLLNPELTATTLDATRFEMRLMTPEYASPEQVRGDPITTASDVYSLGVLLYELLSGHRPYRLKSRQFHEIARVICEEEPTRPSTVIEQVEEVPGREGTARKLTPETVAKTREGTKEKLRRRLTGDLDNIVLMAMRKEPQHRYASVEQLSEDLRRVLEGRPVKARKGTFTYLSTKFIRRHKAALGAAAAVLVALVGFTVFTVRERARAERERDRAESEAAKAEAINEFLQDTMGSADPFEGAGREVTLLEVLTGAVAKIDASFADQPEIKAAVQSTIGETYRNLGRYEEAEPLLRSALEIRKRVFGAEHLEVASSLNDLAYLLHDKGDYEGTESLYREALAMRRQLLGEHLEVANSLNGLADVLGHKADYEAAEPLFKESIAIRKKSLNRNHWLTVEAQSNYGACLSSLGRYRQAEELLLDAHSVQQAQFGEQHARTQKTVGHLVELYEAWGKPKKAAEYRALLEGNKPSVPSS